MTPPARHIPSDLRGRSYDLAIVLGSGLGEFVDHLEDPTVVPYDRIGGLPQPRVPGHKGRIVTGRCEERSLICFQGRYHLYEGYTAAEVGCLVELAAALEVPHLLLTNAAGGLGADHAAGDFMWISDHLNLTGCNPLQGLVPPRFLDLSDLYRADLYEDLRQAAEPQGVRLHQGVLCGLVGPSYETPAEIRMLARLGADAVSMSTVNEAILAHAFGLSVMGLSLISNPAAGLGTIPLDHRDVLSVADRASRQFAALIRSLLPLL